MVQHEDSSRMNAAISPSARDAISHLAASDESLLNARLTELSGLNQAEMKLLAYTWSAIDSERRRQIVHRLVDLAEDNIEFNFDSIFRFCLKDPDDQVRATAIEGFWENEETSLIEPLISLLQKDPSPKVQAAAAVALGKYAVLAEHNKLRPAYKARLAQVLLAAIADKDKPVEVRRRALEAAAAFSLPEIRLAIEEAYQSSDPKLKVSSVFAMGRSLDSAWLPDLLNELSSPDAELRYEACGACGELEEATSVPGLAKLTEDSDADVRIAAIQALGKIGTSQAKACLKKCRASNNESVRQAAEQAMSELSTREDPLSLRLERRDG